MAQRTMARHIRGYRAGVILRHFLRDEFHASINLARGRKAEPLLPQGR